MDEILPKRLSFESLFSSVEEEKKEKAKEKPKCLFKTETSSFNETSSDKQKQRLNKQI